MISRAMWCNKALVNFPKTANCICPTAREFLVVFEKFTHAY